jgi:pimeloyl-ACP methyl ester carboxylesterase
MNIAAFDLLGCGNSDSENLTYGVNEVFDIRDILNEIRKHIKVGRVILWGRSMGSLCAIMFADMYSYEVNGLILDCPFRSLAKVVERIACRKVTLPNFIIRPMLYFIKQRAIKEINYDIFEIDYLHIFKKLNTNLPILFIFSNFDTIVPA